MPSASRKPSCAPPINVESRKYFAALGLRIAALRKSRGYTQAELARQLGVSQQAVFAYEIGERRVSVLVLAKLAADFRMPVEELIGLSKPIQSPTNRLPPRLMRLAERLQVLSKSHQRFVIRIIDCLEGPRP